MKNIGKLGIIAAFLTDAGTVSGTTATFTNLALNGRTGTAASPYAVHVTNATTANSATTATTASNSNLLGGVSLATLRAEIAASGGGGRGTSWVAPSNYSVTSRRYLTTAEAMFNNTSGAITLGNGSTSPVVYITPGSYWRGTVAQLRTAMGLSSSVRYIGLFGPDVPVPIGAATNSDGDTVYTYVPGKLVWADLNAVGTRTLHIYAGTTFNFSR